MSQNQYGTGQYDPNQYDPTQYGQNQYGQNEYGQSQYGTSQYDPNLYGQQDPAQPYAQQGYGHPQGVQPYAQPYATWNKPTAPSAVPALVLGLLGLFTGLLILSPIAWAMGAKARREANTGQYEVGLGTAGWVMGIIGTVLLIISMVFLVIYLAALGYAING